ncbi:MAG TPA: PQQ-binding-like beta-propeller repeat protein [Ktedonobacteraceae bacterium]
MEQHNSFFTPDEVDQQIEQLMRSTPSHPSQEPASTDLRLIRHLQTFYQEESAEVDQRSLERVGALLQQSQGLIFDRDDRERLFRETAETRSGARQGQPDNLSRRPHRNRIWQRRINLIAAVVLLTLLVSSMVLVLGLAHSSKNSAAGDTDTAIYTLQLNNLYKLDLQRKSIAWSAPITTSGYTEGTVGKSDGIVYVGASIEGKDYTDIPYAFAYNARTGALLWRVKLDSATSKTAQDGNVQLGFTAQPVVANGRVYFISNAGKIYALDALTGGRRWVYDTHEIAMSCTGEPGKPNYYCSPILEPGITVGGDGVVYAWMSNYLFAVNGINGSKIWAASISFPYYIESLVFSEGNLYLTARSFHFDDPASRYHHLYAFNARTGQQRWLVSEYSAGFGTPVIVNGIVYVGSAEGTLYAFHSSDGSPLWHKSLSGQILVDLSESDGVIYVQTNVIKNAGSRHPASSALAAFNTADGSLRWQRTIDTHNTVPDYQVVTGGVIYLVMFVFPPPKVEKNVIITLPGHFVIDAYSASDGHKL